MKTAKTLDNKIILYYNRSNIKCDDGIIRNTDGTERERVVEVLAAVSVADLSGAVKTATYACVKGFEWFTFLVSNLGGNTEFYGFVPCIWDVPFLFY